MLAPMGLRRGRLNGDDLGGNAGERGDPIDEASLKMFCIERGEDVTEVAVRRCSVGTWPEPPQKRKLHFPEAGDIDEAFRTRQNGEQAQEQHLVEWKGQLSGLAIIRQVLEIFEKNGRFRLRSTARRFVRYRSTLFRIRGSRQIQRFSRLSRTSSPDCPALGFQVGCAIAPASASPPREPANPP